MKPAMRSTCLLALVPVMLMLSCLQPADALTFKKDGSVLQKDGTVVQQSDEPGGSAPSIGVKTPPPIKTGPIKTGPIKTAPPKAIAAGRIPDWCAAPPENTIFRVSACGTANSPTLSMAKSRALLDAKRQLADVVNGAVEFANNSVVSSANEVPIRGYRRISEETLTIKGRLHHFVLLQMEIGPAADLMTKSLEYSIDRFKRSCPDGWKKVDNGCVIY